MFEFSGIPRTGIRMVAPRSSHGGATAGCCHGGGIAHSCRSTSTGWASGIAWATYCFPHGPLGSSGTGGGNGVGRSEDISPEDIRKSGRRENLGGRGSQRLQAATDAASGGRRCWKRQH